VSSQSRSLKLLSGIQFSSLFKGDIVWRQNACVTSDSVQRCFQQDNLHRTHNLTQIASMFLACPPPMFLYTLSSRNWNNCYSYLQKRFLNILLSSKTHTEHQFHGKIRPFWVQSSYMLYDITCICTQSLCSTRCAFVHRHFNCPPVILISLERDPPPSIIQSLEHSLIGTFLCPCFSLHFISPVSLA